MILRGKQKWIYNLIKNAGPSGINTNELRNTTHTVDVPKAVSELVKKNVRIVSERQKDGTATYKLAEQPTPRIISYTKPDGTTGYRYSSLTI